MKISLVIISLISGFSLLSGQDIIELYVGQQKALSVNNASQIFIAGQGRIARGTLVKGGGEAIITGVRPGVVSMIINYRDGRKETVSVRVVGREAEELYVEVKRILSDIPALKVRRVGRGVELSGRVESEAQARKVALVMARYPEVMDFTRDVRTDRIIQMDVEIVEISLSDNSNLGIDWFGATSTRAKFPEGMDYGNIVTQGAEMVVGEKNIPGRIFPDPAYAVGTLARLNPITAKLHFLIQEGKGSILARPKLVCRSGDSASFLVGGEVPLPYATQEQIEVNWKAYGIKLDVNPVLMKNNGGEMEVGIRCEISDLDWANSVQDYPALSRKVVRTNVKMNADEMLALAGLISRKKFRVQKKMPVLGYIPLLGRLFSSTRDEVKDMETVILLTPRIIKPGKGDNIKVGRN
jgi:Flp pilus assembly secretin CpaC